jgi:hypothetical protein
MGRAYCATTLVVACLLICQSSRAQLTFIAGPQFTVSGGALYIAAADFNNDNIEDAGAMSTGAAVTVLFGSPDGSFKSPVAVPVGKYLHGIVTGDFSRHMASGDRGAVDIAIVGGAKAYRSKAFILQEQVKGGIGTGMFNAPVSFPLRHRAVDLAAGHFDCPASGCTPPDPIKSRLDIVTANGASNTLTLLLNPDPKDSGTYTLQPDIFTGRNPHAVKAQDFDNKNGDDIAVLCIGYKGGDVLSVYLNNGNGAFSSASYPTGVAALALTIGNFHSNIDTDSVFKDVAVLNKGPRASNGQATQSSVSLLLNTDGTIVGTGSFMSLPSLKVSCPAKLNGIPITCVPQSITSGDFDGDGFDDLAVAFRTQALTTYSATAGFVNVYTGRGNGMFDFAAQVLVGLRPGNMVAGDFTGHGNGVQDIAVTESGSSTVRILQSVPPPPKPKGWTCNSDIQCEAGLHCVDYICCALPDNDLTCPSNEFCNIPGSLGTCSAPGPDGNPCSSAEQCQSGSCVDGFCCSTPSCDPGEYCTNNGQCAGPAELGIPCTSDEQCKSGYCVDGVCCESDICASNQACNIPGFEGECTLLLSPGDPCTKPVQCDTGFCADGVCCYSEWCPTGQACNMAGSLGQCAYLPTPTPTITRTPTVTRTPTPTLTPTPVPIGGQCTPGVTVCESPDQCVDGICCRTACNSGEYCNITNFVGTCHARLPDTWACSLNTDCLSGYCAPSGKCAPAPTATPTPTPTPTPTQTPLSPGDHCIQSSQCPSSYVCNVDEHVCCEESQCPTGQSCKLPDSPGWCEPIPTVTPTTAATATPTDTPTVTPTPCDEASCETQGPGWRCDITGYEGTCSPPMGLGEGPCSKNTDCETAPVLICNQDTQRCDYSSNPTPAATLTPTPVTPLTCPQGMVLQGGKCVSVSRSGGCSIGDASATATAATDAWLVALLPLAFAIRRLRRQDARAHAHRRARTH